MSRVAILLSTYNGEAFLNELIESLLKQTFTDWTLICRDDRSQDSTPVILRRYAGLDPRVRLHDQIRANVGVIKSFGILLGNATQFDFVFFCDQDDIWSPTKVETFVQEFERQQAAQGAGPLAIHSDLEIMSADGKTLGPSFRKKVGLPVAVDSIWPLLGRNFVTGCALAMNRPLVKLAVPIAKDALMHDWWIALIAAATGHFAYIDQPLVRYRQHSKNASGALAEFGLINKIRRRLFNLEYFRELMMRRFRQSLAVEQHLRSVGRQQLADQIHGFHSDVVRGRWSAVASSRAKGIHLYGPLRTLFYRIFLWMYQPRIAKLIRLQSSLQRWS